VTGAELRRLLEPLARNLAYAWLPRVRDVFPALDAELWRAVDHNPVALLAGLPDERLEAAAADDAFLARVDGARRALDAELRGPTWWEEQGPLDGFLVAYFSAEFGVDESLPLYSGGLGVLAGDHLKSASELGVPLVGVGLFYREGYFRQELDDTGRQQERYPVSDPARLPVEAEPVEVEVELAGETVAARVWRADVGRTRLYLLDTDVERNSPEARAITDRLYGGDREHRLRQELVLGVGGVRALRALGLEPAVFHMNEGHSAFLALERLREGLDLDEVRASTIFTTHTPVPAGNEVFDAGLVRRYVEPYLAGTGLDWEDFAALGSTGDPGSVGLTPLALRTADRANGVSELHGEVARDMWSELGVPIGSITNGVHARTWLAPALADRLGGDWSRVRELSDAELWQLHADGKRALLGGDPDLLTIGFARRFATYKRAGLLFSDLDRLAAILDRGVRIVMAGKSHPADEGGKGLIQEVWRLAQDERLGGRVTFLPDYEMTLARSLVQGVDVWLNTPLRPLEASGTSGMKAAMNGALNCSILDGWWCEGYSPETGFAIVAEPADDQDAADAAALYDVLEREVLPSYEDRPRWLAMMRASIERLGPRFNTNRMVREYVEDMYLPAARAGSRSPV
jgi:glycogen phosphorylase